MILLYAFIGAIILFVILYLYSTTLRSRYSTKGTLEKYDPQDHVAMFTPGNYHDGGTSASGNKWVAIKGRDLSSIYEEDD